MGPNTYHVLEPPPAGKQHSLESFRSQKSLSEKPERHKLDTTQLHNSYSQLETAASKSSSRLHYYHKVGATAKKPGNELSHGLVMKPGSGRDSFGPGMLSQETTISTTKTPVAVAAARTTPHYHILEIEGGRKVEAECSPPQHHYDTVNTRRRQSAAAAVEQVQPEEYNTLGVPPHRVVNTNSNRQPAQYQTIGNH